MRGENSQKQWKSVLNNLELFRFHNCETPQRGRERKLQIWKFDPCKIVIPENYILKLCTCDEVGKSTPMQILVSIGTVAAVFDFVCSLRSPRSNPIWLPAAILKKWIWRYATPTIVWWLRKVVKSKLSTPCKIVTPENFILKLLKVVKSKLSTPCRIVIPENFISKLCTRAYVGEIARHANFGFNRYSGCLFWRSCPPVLSNRWTDFRTSWLKRRVSAQEWSYWRGG